MQVEEVLQETWLRAWSKFDAFDVTRVGVVFLFVGWVSTIARNVVREARRRAASRGLRRADIVDLGISEPVAETGQCPVVAALAKERDERVQAMLERLSRRERLVVVGHGMHGRPLAEIARELGVTVAAATKFWQRCVARLRQDVGWRDAASSSGM